MQDKEEMNLSNVWTQTFLHSHSSKRPITASSLHNGRAKEHPFGMTSTSYTHCKRRDPNLNYIVNRLVANRQNDLPGLSASRSMSTLSGLQARKYVPLNLDMKKLKNNR